MGPCTPLPLSHVSGAPSPCLSCCTPSARCFWGGPETLTLWSGAALGEAGGLSPFTWAAGRCGPPGRECRGRPGLALCRNVSRGSRPGAARRAWWSPHRTQVPTGACPASAPAPAALASSPAPPWRCLSHSYLLPQEEPGAGCGWGLSSKPASSAAPHRRRLQADLECSPGALGRTGAGRRQPSWTLTWRPPQDP